MQAGPVWFRRCGDVDRSLQARRLGTPEGPAAALAGWDHVRLAEDEIRLARPGMALTLNGRRRLYEIREVTDTEQRHVKARSIDPEVFDLPIDKIRSGYYSDAYFNHTQKVLVRDGHRPRVLVQVFQRGSSVLCGVDEAIATLRECAGIVSEDGAWEPAWEDLVVRSEEHTSELQSH